MKRIGCPHLAQCGQPAPLRPPHPDGSPLQHPVQHHTHLSFSACISGRPRERSSLCEDRLGECLCNNSWTAYKKRVWVFFSPSLWTWLYFTKYSKAGKLYFWKQIECNETKTLSAVVDTVIFLSLRPWASLSSSTKFASKGIIFQISENVTDGGKSTGQAWVRDSKQVCAASRATARGWGRFCYANSL